MGKEASELYRHLASERPEPHQWNLAVALIALTSHLVAAERRVEAAAVGAEAVNGLRSLVAVGQSTYIPALAHQLHNNNNNLSHLGHPREAFELAQEAVALWRDLDEKESDTHRSKLAVALNSLARRWSELGDGEKASDFADEAIRLLAPFFRDDPAAYRSWTKALLDDYQRFSSTVGREVDVELTGPLREQLERR